MKEIHTFLQHLNNLFRVIFISLSTPILFPICLYFGTGGRISGLTIGIVNYEVNSFMECSNESLITIQKKDFDCYVNKISCRFINEIGDDLADHKKMFSSHDEAFAAAKRGDIFGFIQFSSNFTESVPIFNLNELDESGVIKVYMDKSDLQKKTLIERKLFEVYDRFVEKVMVDCEYSRKVGKSPITFEALYGIFDFSFKTTMISAFLIT